MIPLRTRHTRIGARWSTAVRPGSPTMAHFACHLDGRRRGLCEALNVRRINHRLRVDHAVEREVIERFAVNDGLCGACRGARPTAPSGRGWRGSLTPVLQSSQDTSIPLPGGRLWRPSDAAAASQNCACDVRPPTSTWAQFPLAPWLTHTSPQAAGSLGAA